MEAIAHGLEWGEWIHQKKGVDSGCLHKELMSAFWFLLFLLFL